VRSERGINYDDDDDDDDDDNNNNNNKTEEIMKMFIICTLHQTSLV
jgi:hypothetical protein